MIEIFIQVDYQSLNPKTLYISVPWRIGANIIGHCQGCKTHFLKFQMGLAFYLIIQAKGARKVREGVQGTWTRVSFSNFVM